MSRRQRGRRALVAIVALSTVVTFAQSYAWPDIFPPWFELFGRAVFCFYWGSQLIHPFGHAIDDAQHKD